MTANFPQLPQHPSLPETDTKTTEQVEFTMFTVVFSFNETSKDLKKGWLFENSTENQNYHIYRKLSCFHLYKNGNEKQQNYLIRYVINIDSIMFSTIKLLSCDVRKHR